MGRKKLPNTEKRHPIQASVEYETADAVELLTTMRHTPGRAVDFILKNAMKNEDFRNILTSLKGNN
jgi:hypothetical protein